MPPMLMQHSEDPAEVILKKIGMKKLGELTHSNGKPFRIMANQLLLAVYERPRVTKSGIHLADSTVAEDAHQGKAALCLLKGRSAFISDSNYDFGSGPDADNVEPGDWVAIFVSDGRRVIVNGVLCRIVEDCHVRMKLPAPDVVW